MAFQTRRAGLLAAFALAAAPLAAQQAPPSPEQVLGYALGQRFTPTAGVRQYMHALAAAAPDRVQYRTYGVTPEGRELVQVVIARPENLRRLNEILAANAELTRPETPLARAQQIAASNPAIVYFSYGVHGNESSSSEAAMWTAWDLAREAPDVRGVLDSLVVVIDPTTNPDGRDRYVNWFTSVVGATPNPDPEAREHREPWPGGRYNHYYFDLNRDWAWATQPETRARLATWSTWNPQVHVDFHEMFFNSTYFFFPATAPINPIYPPYVLAWARRFGQSNARAFDAHGWAYYTGEEFDLFYPGYGDSWPSLTGAIGMTYEQAGHGAAGLAIRRDAGDTLTLHDRAWHHWTTSEATLRTAAAGRTQLLLDYAAGQRSVGEGVQDVLLVPGVDPSRVEALVAHLRREGIEVERSTAGFAARADAYPGFDARSQFPAGTYRVRARQPRGRLAVTLLQPETQLKAEYSYDISAWSLPYAYGVAAYRVGATGASWSPVAGNGDEPAPAQARPAGYGYLVLPGAADAGLVRFLRAGGHVSILGKSTTLGGRRWPAGTWFVPAARNDSVQVRLTRAGLGAAAVPVASGLSEAEGGIDLGSERVEAVRMPRVAVLAGDGVDAGSFGAMWFYLEQQLGLPFDAVQPRDLGDVDLSKYDVVVVPDASARALPKANLDGLKAWVEHGGRLVAVAGGAEIVAGIADIKTREAPKADTARARLLAGREERQRQEWRQEVPGTILPLTLDPAHPLAWGAGLDAHPDRTYTLHQGTLVFEPSEGAEAVAFFPEHLARVSGVISPENLRRAERGVWLVSKQVGSGNVVLFADDPLFRLFWKSTLPMFDNALLLKP